MLSQKSLKPGDTGISCQVRVTTSAGREALGEVRLRHWTHKERTFRALKAWLICWGLAVVVIFIPMLHFILVPSFLIAGPFLAYRTLGQEDEVLGGQSVCPDCGANLILVRAPDKWPLTDLCSKCQVPVKVEKVAS